MTADPHIQHGECREATCIELSDEYCHLARERIAREMRPGTHVPEEGREVLPLFAKGAMTE